MIVTKRYIVRFSLQQLSIYVRATVPLLYIYTIPLSAEYLSQLLFILIYIIDKGCRNDFPIYNL